MASLLIHDIPARGKTLTITQDGHAFSEELLPSSDLPNVNITGSGGIATIVESWNDSSLYIIVECRYLLP